MRIPHGHGDRLMTQQFFHNIEVNTLLDQPRCKGMSERFLILLLQLFVIVPTYECQEKNILAPSYRYCFWH